MQDYIVYKNSKVYFSSTGNGNAIVLLHGFLENSSMWNKLMPQVLKTNRVICIDLLGHGQTGCLGYIHSMEDMANAVNAVLLYLKIKQSVFIGHSLGGYVALAFAELFPDKLKGLCLMNSTTEADSPERKLNRDRAIQAVKQNYKIFVSIAISNLFAPNNRIKLVEEINTVKKEALKTSLQGIIAALEGMKIRKDRTQIFIKLNCKKLFIIGEQDPIINYDLLTTKIDIPNLKIVKIAGGHMSYIENKKDLSYSILRFIEK